jgi:hypothetical protein
MSDTGGFLPGGTTGTISSGGFEYSAHEDTEERGPNKMFGSFSSGM